MFEKLVKKIGITVVVIWTTLFFNGRFQIINSWNFPEAMFFVAATVLGAVGAILLIGIILRDLVFRQFLNVELVFNLWSVACSACVYTDSLWLAKLLPAESK